MASRTSARAHGSFYRYDTDVPVFFLGAPFAAGYFGETAMVDLAATLARLLDVNQPASCEGHADRRDP